MLTNTKKALLTGKSYLQSSLYEEAITCLQIAQEDVHLQSEALEKLLQSEIKRGNYKKVREALQETQVLDRARLYNLYRLLETVENNFEAGKEYCKKGQQDLDPIQKHSVLLTYARLQVNTGNYEEAKQLLKILAQHPKFYSQVGIDLAILAMRQYEWKEAQYILDHLNLSALDENQLRNRENLITYTHYFLGELSMSEQQAYRDQSFSTSILFDSDEERVIAHIDRHKNKARMFAYGCLLEDLDTRTLLDLAKTKIEQMNANYFDATDQYCVHFDFPVGIRNGQLVNDLRVTTILNTKKVITMYPIRISDEFDKEGQSTSEKLKQKRLDRGR